MNTRIWVATVLTVGLLGCSEDDESGTGGADAGMDARGAGDARQGAKDSNDNAFDSGTDTPAIDAGVDANSSEDASLPASDASLSDAAPSSISAVISATAGGQIPLLDAQLFALAGSVAADKSISLSATPATGGTPRSADVTGLIYSIGPDNLVFDAPVQLTLMIKGALPEGKKVSLAYLEGNGSWTSLQSVWDEKTSQVSGLIKQGGAYALLLNPISTDVSCPAAMNCGGMLSGSYQYGGECSRVLPVQEPVACGPTNKATVTSETVRTGTITFSGLTFTTNTTNNKRVDLRTDAACTAFGQSAGDLTCADVASRLMQSKLYTWSCSGDVNNQCFCSGLLQQEQQLTGAFLAREGELTLTPLAGANETKQNYCVAGNVVTLGDANMVTTLIKAP